VANFEQYIGIDYSGAKTPTSSLKGLRIYSSRGDEPREVLPPPSPRKYWTRQGAAEWLLKQLSGNLPTLVGIDHGFSFPQQYFDTHRLPHDWPAFLDDFQSHWPTDQNIKVDTVRQGLAGNGSARLGDTRWRRLTEKRAGTAKSVFHFDVQGSVAKSTHAGIPWLRFLRRSLGAKVHFWPFDGWNISAGRSAVVEVYPALWSRAVPRSERTQDQHGAYCVATWLADADLYGKLYEYLNPKLSESEQTRARFEGWILGVT